MISLSKRQVQTLTTVATFGYLTTREIAKLVAPGITPKAALKAAQLTTTELCKEGMLLQRASKRNCGAAAFVVTRKGADYLNAWYICTDFQHGYDLDVTRQIIRGPVIDLCHELAKTLDLATVGPKGLGGFLGGYGAINGVDAILIDPNSMLPVFRVYLAREYTEAVTARVRKLAHGLIPLLLAGSPGAVDKLEALIRARASAAPELERVIAAKLPLGLEC